LTSPYSRANSIRNLFTFVNVRVPPVPSPLTATPPIIYMKSTNFLQEKAVEATKQEKERKEEKT
jgi:hypothetical protein